MSVLFKSAAKKNPRDISAPLKYYATAIQKDVTNTDKLFELISASSTVSRSDVYSVVIELLEKINYELSEGRTVRLDKLGKFSLSIQSEGVDAPEDLTSNQIRNAKINFLPDKEMKDMLKTLKFEKKN